MAYYHSQYNFLFFIPAGAGRTSLAPPLRQIGCVNIPPQNVDTDYRYITATHCRPIDFQKNPWLRPGVYENVFRISVARNPLSYVLNMYLRFQDIDENDPRYPHRPYSWRRPYPNGSTNYEEILMAKALSLHDWLRYLKARRVTKPRHVFDGFQHGIDHYVRFENLEEDFEQVMRERGVTEGWNFVDRTVNRITQPLEYYYEKQATVDLVYHMHRPDFIKFGYNRILFP